MSDPMADLPYVRRLRECIYCHGKIAPQRPLFLVSDDTGAILGPFHAGCAERVKIDAERRLSTNWIKGATEYGTWPPKGEAETPCQQ